MGVGLALITTAWTAVSAFATSSIIGGAIVGAVVGAAIGGLGAAITGGDIGKGILFGAIGGAVTGGLASWAGGASMLGGAGTGTGTGGLSGATQALGSGTGIPSGGGTMISRGLDAAGSLMKSGSGEILAEFVVKAGEVMMTPDPQEDYGKTKEYLDKKLESDLERQRIASAAGGGSVGGGAGHDPANMANVALQREKWQYDISKAEQMEQQRTEAMESVRKRRQPDPSGKAIKTKSTITTLDERRAEERAKKAQSYITPITPPVSPPVEAPALTPPTEEVTL